jgi:hypothetical protein
MSDVTSSSLLCALDAALRDEGHGVSAPARSGTNTKISLPAKPVECPRRGPDYGPREVSGTFDSSPANLTQCFGFAGDGRIGALEVRCAGSPSARS